MDSQYSSLNQTHNLFPISLKLIFHCNTVLLTETYTYGVHTMTFDRFAILKFKTVFS